MEIPLTRWFSHTTLTVRVKRLRCKRYVVWNGWYAGAYWLSGALGGVHWTVGYRVKGTAYPDRRGLRGWDGTV
jgi:hypothetical protein